MESLIYHLNRSELTAALWEEIRNRVNTDIHGERITIVIEPETAELRLVATPQAPTLSEFEKKILDSVNDPVSFVFEGNEFEEFTEKLLKNETVNTEQYKRVRL